MQTNPPLLPIERLNAGQPILAPTANWWENGVTFNPSAVYLEPTLPNQALIRSLLPMFRPDDPRLARGVVAIHYRARPERDPGSDFERSFIGLALFTPTLAPLYRYAEPVLSPSPDPHGCDTYGVEDPRVHRFGDAFAMVYCGVQPDPLHGWQARLCLAESRDLLRWDRLGTLPGDITTHNNKDGALFPAPIGGPASFGGQYYLLHRPFAESWPKSDYAIRLAASHTLRGPWRDLGEVLHALPNPRARSTWVGAGAPPIPAGGQRFIEIYHTGSYRSETDRQYNLAAALLDFERFDPLRPAALVRARIEPLMVPETEAELRSRSRLQVANVLFACGAYEYQGWIYIVYGGADTYTLAARLRKDALLEALLRAEGG